MKKIFKIGIAILLVLFGKFVYDVSFAKTTIDPRTPQMIRCITSDPDLIVTADPLPGVYWKEHYIKIATDTFPYVRNDCYGNSEVEVCLSKDYEMIPVR